MNYALFKLPVISSAATKVEWIHQGATERDMERGGILVAELERSYPAEVHGVHAFLQALQRNRLFCICYPWPDSCPFLQGQFCKVRSHSCSLVLLAEGMENEETTGRLRAQRALTFHL